MKNLLVTLALAVLATGASAQDRVGSIYKPNRGPQGSIANKTARRAGDLLTVVISENQDVNHQETTDFTRESSLDYALTAFDIKPNAFSPLPTLAGDSMDELKGTANYQKSGAFTARLTAIIVDVLPNGTMVVSGRREIRIDQETKVLEISGIVRRYDIRPDNTIQSELVANAKVSYAGQGPLTNATNRKGLGGAIFEALAWLWPF